MAEIKCPKCGSEELTKVQTPESYGDVDWRRCKCGQLFEANTGQMSTL